MLNKLLFLGLLMSYLRYVGIDSSYEVIFKNKFKLPIVAILISKYCNTLITSDDLPKN